MKKPVARAASTLSLAALGALALGQSYHVARYDLGVQTSVSRIEPSGLLLGYAMRPDGYTDAFYDAGQGPRLLGSLAGLGGIVAGIDASGTMVGSSRRADGRYQAVTYDASGNPHAFETLGGTESWATGVSAAGAIAGYETLPGTGTVHRSFVRANGQVTDLGTLDGRDTIAYGMNAAGQIVGKSDVRPGANQFTDRARPFLWENGTMRDLGTLSGGSGQAVAINDRGQAVGIAGLTGGDTHACLWAAGSALDLGTLPGKETSFALGINDQGDVVGFGSHYQGPLGPAQAAFLYRDGAMRDLNTLLDSSGAGLTLIEGDFISAAGQISALATDANGHRLAVVLTPNPVPEPASLAALGLGAVAFLRRRKRG